MHSEAVADADRSKNAPAAASEKDLTDRPSTMTVPIALLVIVAITLWRILCLRFDTTDLFVDEAQYWLWSTHPGFGYYSKPPMIAWVIYGVTHLVGSDAIFWIRVSGPLLHMLTALVLMKTAGYFGGPAVRAWTGITFITLPGVAFSSIFFSTDVVLLPYFALALWSYVGLTRRRSLRLAILFGLAFSGAFLSKYAILFVLPGGLIALSLMPSARIAWRDFFVAAVVALLGALPNLWWNAENQLTTVRHTETIAGWSRLSLHSLGAIEFFAAQPGIVGPIIFLALSWAAFRIFKGEAGASEKLLFWLSVPVVLLITLQALMAKAYANWAVTAYVAGTVLAVLILCSRWPRGLMMSLAVNGTVSLLLPLCIVFSHELRLPDGSEVMKRYLGRAQVSREAADIAADAKLGIIVSDDRSLLADMFYTLRNDQLKIYAPPQSGLPRNYYEQVFAMPPSVTESVLLITRKPATCAGSAMTELRRWRPFDGVYKGSTFYAYLTSPQCLVR